MPELPDDELPVLRALLPAELHEVAAEDRVVLEPVPVRLGVAELILLAIAGGAGSEELDEAEESSIEAKSEGQIDSPDTEDEEAPIDTTDEGGIDEEEPSSAEEELESAEPEEED